MKSKKTNESLKTLIRDLKRLSTKEKVNVWRAIAKNLEKSTRRKRTVNLSKIEKHSKDNETIVVPGKVLGNGEISKNIEIAAFQFSETARKKFKNHLSINDIMKKNPKGSNVRILG